MKMLGLLLKNSGTNVKAIVIQKDLFLVMHVQQMNTEKKNLAYCINKFSNPKVNKFFSSKGVVIDEDANALADLVQWIFRSQLRYNKPINIYIPSERMKQLLINWLNSDK